MSRYITNDVIAEVMRRCEGKCVHCGSITKLQLGHIIAFSKGGSNSVANLIIECEKCNLKKGTDFIPTIHLDLSQFTQDYKLFKNKKKVFEIIKNQMLKTKIPNKNFRLFLDDFNFTKQEKEELYLDFLYEHLDQQFVDLKKINEKIEMLDKELKNNEPI